MRMRLHEAQPGAKATELSKEVLNNEFGER